MTVVDVLVASYNHQPYLEQMIASVLANYDKVPLHIWVVDDGSTDGSVEYLKSLDDERVSVSFNEKNMGISYTANKAYDMGSSPFVAYIGSDDRWAPDKLSRQLELIENEADKVSFTLVEYIDETGKVLPNGLGPYNQDTFKCNPTWDRYDWLRLLSGGGNKLCAPSFLGRRAIVDRAGPMDLRMHQTNDLEHWTRVLQYADPIILPEQLVQYRLNSEGTNTSASSKENIARLYVECSLVAKKFYRAVPDDVFKKMYAHMIARAGKFPFDTKIRVLMATKKYRLQMAALELLAENLETKREASGLTYKDFHAFAGQLRR